MWGDGFKIVTRKFAKTLPVLSGETLRGCLEVLFPAAVPLQEERLEVTEVPMFTQAELLNAVKQLSSRKSPGLDMIPAEAVVAMMGVAPQLLLEVYNSVLQGDDLPVEWKVGRIVLIRKEGRLANDPAGYRPLCLLSNLSKVFERMVVGRLEAEVEERGGLHAAQFSFRRG